MPRLPVNSSDYFIFQKKKTTKCRSQLLCNLLQMWQVAQHRQQMLTNCENYHFSFSMHIPLSIFKHTKGLLLSFSYHRIQSSLCLFFTSRPKMLLHCRETKKRNLPRGSRRYSAEEQKQSHGGQEEN